MILRTVKDGHWSVINNTVLNDERLSWRARGIAAYLLTKPDDWRIDHTHLWRSGKEGRDAVLTAMKELATYRYLIRKVYQKPDGKFATEVVLHETPQPEGENFDALPAPEDSLMTEPLRANIKNQETDFQEPNTENQESVNQESVFQDSLLVLKPITEIEKDEEDPRAGDAIEAAWLETYGAYMPENILQPMNMLLTECGEAAVIHAIQASTGSESRSFRYLASCARNYIPPAPEIGAATSYRVDLPMVAPAPKPPKPTSMVPGKHVEFKFDERSAVSADDIWRERVLPEIVPQLKATAGGGMLEGSHMARAGELAGLPFFEIAVCGGADLAWLNNRAAGLVRRTLGSILLARVEVAFVAAELEPTP